MGPKSSPYTIPNNSLHNPFPHSLLRTRQSCAWPCLPYSVHCACHLVVLRFRPLRGRLCISCEPPCNFCRSIQCILEFPKIKGTLFWGPYNKDHTIWGTRLGSPISETPISGTTRTDSIWFYYFRQRRGSLSIGLFA